MATNKIHFLAFQLFSVTDSNASDYSFTENDAAIIITNDSMRCWSGPRDLTHFTLNPLTGEISGMKFPTIPIGQWNENTVKDYAKETGFSAGKPGEACIDEATVPAWFWEFNDYSKQNALFYMHLVQDKSYDRFLRSYIDTSKRYEGKYEFEGKIYSGDDIRGKGIQRWNGDGLINQFDEQFFVRLAKKYYEATGIQANREWIEQVMKPAIFKTYSPAFAEKTVNFISMSNRSDEIITQANFDMEVWPLKNSVVDQAVEWMLEDMKDALLSLAMFQYNL